MIRHFPISLRSTAQKTFRFLSKGQNHPLILPSALVLLLFSAQLILMKPYFLVNDDVFKILMAKGIGPVASPTPYVGYSNILWGYLLVFLYRLAPGFPWHGGLLCLAQGLALGCILWVACLKAAGRGLRILVFTGLWAGIYFLFFTYLQFTMAAILCAQAGIFLTVFCPESLGQKNKTLGPILGAGLLLLSELIRQDSLLLTALVALPLMAFRWRDPAFRVFLGKRKYLLLCALAGVFLLGLFHFCWFQQSAPWRDYARFDSERLELKDYRISSYNPQTKPYFDKVGWSPNDLWLFNNYYFANPLKFNVQKFQELKSHFPRFGTEGKTATFHSLPELLLSSWDQRMILLFLALLVLCPLAPRLYLLAQLAWVAGLFWFLIYFYRAPDRVTLPVLAFLLNAALFYLEPAARKGRGLWERIRLSWQWVVLPLGLLALLPTLMDYHRQNLERRAAERGLQDCLARLAPTDQHYYVCWEFPFEIINAFDDFEAFRHFHMFGVVYSQTCPPSLQAMGAFGMSEPFRDLVNRPGAFLICSTGQGPHYHDYLRENFGMEITAKAAFLCPYFKVYSIIANK